MRALRIISAALLCFFTGRSAPTQSAGSFEVVSIHRSATDSDTETRRLPGGRLMITGLTVKGLIRRAWDVQDYQILGCPGWAATERFDIAAKAPEGTPADWPLNPLMQAMMASRFRLRVHSETKVLRRFKLVTTKERTKLVPAQPGAKTDWKIAKGSIIGRSVTMQNLAVNMLPRALDRWVNDETGTTGKFDVELRWNPDEVTASNATTDSGPSLFAAIQEQLGLKLVPDRGPVPVIVVDSVERPALD